MKKVHTVKRTLFYRQAFEIFSAAKESEYKIKEEYENGPYLVSWKEEIYRVISLSDYVKDCMYDITDVYYDMNIPVELWIKVAHGVIRKPEFHSLLLKSISEEQEMKLLNLAINISLISDEPEQTFWSTLSSKFDSDIYKKAILAAAKVSDKDKMAVDLARLFILYGSEYMNETGSGIFEAVESSSPGEQYFIFHVDPVRWENSMAITNDLFS